MKNGEKQQRLSSDLLATLASCCQPDKAKGTWWPSGELLQSLEDSVKLLIAEERKKPVSWKTFRRLDKRMPTLRLVLRVDNLVKHARERLAEAGESALDKLARQGGGGGQKLLRDIERLRNDLSNAKAIDWEQHQSALKWLSGSGTLSCGDSPASPKVICYARTLELLVDDCRREPLRRQSRPLLEWLARIGHPEARCLLAFDYELERVIERKEKDSHDKKALQRRQKGSERTRRHREWYRGKMVYPGGWIRTTLTDRFLPAESIPAKLECELCHKTVSKPHWYYHLDRHVLRCDHCQFEEWLSEGREMDVWEEAGYEAYSYPVKWPSREKEH